MRERNVFLASADKKNKKIIKKHLLKNGYSPIGEADNSSSALRLIRTIKPHLVILDRELPGLNSFEVAAILEEDQIAPVILLLSSWNQQILSSIDDTWIFSFLIKPITEQGLRQALETALTNFQRIRRKEKEIQDLRETLETRKLVAQAKGYLMEELKLSEEEAYRRLQKHSMDQGISLRSVARRVIKYRRQQQ